MNLKNLFIFALIAAVIVLLLLHKCDGGDIQPKVTIDTVWKEVKGDTQYIPMPFEVFVPGKVPKPLEKWDTLYVEGVTVDTLAILRDYHSFYIYKDTIDIIEMDNNLAVLDSSGNVRKLGDIKLFDTVSRNKILGRGVSYNIRYPEVTITKEYPAKKRNQVYGGGGVFGNRHDPLSGFSVRLDLKTKSEQLIGGQYMKLFDGANYYGLNLSMLIRIKKPR